MIDKETPSSSSVLLVAVVVVHLFCTLSPFIHQRAFLSSPLLSGFVCGQSTCSRISPFNYCSLLEFNIKKHSVFHPIVQEDCKVRFWALPPADRQQLLLPAALPGPCNLSTQTQQNIAYVDENRSNSLRQDSYKEKFLGSIATIPSLARTTCPLPTLYFIFIISVGPKCL